MGCSQRSILKPLSKELELADEDKLMALENIQANKAKVLKLYNKKVKPKLVAEGDLMSKAILPVGTKSSKFENSPLIEKGLLL